MQDTCEEDMQYALIVVVVKSASQTSRVQTVANNMRVTPFNELLRFYPPPSNGLNILLLNTHLIARIRRDRTFYSVPSNTDNVLYGTITTEIA